MSTTCPGVARHGVLPWAVLYGLGYLVLNELGVQLGLPPSGFSVFWPAAGLALAVFFRADTRAWPALVAAQAVANLAGNLAHGTPARVVVWFVVANLLESVGGAAALRRWEAGTRGRTRTTALLVGPVVVVVVSTMVSAVVAAAGLVWFGDVEGGFALAWRTWWVADAVGILTLAPVVIFWPLDYRWFAARSRRVELIACLLVVFTVASVVFLNGDAEGPPHSTVYFLVPVLLWPALRLGRAATATAFAITVVIGVQLTAGGHGPFARAVTVSVGEALDAQLFLSIIGSTMLVVAWGVELTRSAERAAGVMTSERAERDRLEELLAETAVLAAEREDLLDRAHLLAEVSEVLDEALAVDAQLARLASVLSRRLGAWCGIDLLVEESSGQTLVPRAQAGPFRIETYPRPLPVYEPLATALSGQPVLVREMTAASLRRRVTNEERLQALTNQGLISAIVAPITTGGAVYGLIHLLSDNDQVRFDENDVGLAFDVGRRAGQAVRNAQQFEREREISTRLQASLLPDSLPNHPSVQLAARYRPGEEGLDVGGDWYDAFFVADGRLAVAVGDVVGGGLQAASATGQLRSAVRALARRCNGPADVLTELDAFASVVAGADVATLAYLELDLSSGELRYACAGHPPPLVVDADGTSRFLEGGRSTPLVTVAHPRRIEASTVLGEGETLFVFTDGLFERRRETIDDGLARLAGVAGAQIGAETLDSAVDELVRILLADHPASDDVCVVAVARTARDPSRFRRVIAADPARLAEVRGELRSWLRRRGLAEECIVDVVLATFEAAANSVEHAYRDRRPGTVTLDARLSDDEIVVEVHDQGAWRAPAAPGERGRGTGLMRTLMDIAEISRTPAGTRVELRRRLVVTDGAGRIASPGRV